MIFFFFYGSFLGEGEESYWPRHPFSKAGSAMKMIYYLLDKKRSLTKHKYPWNCTRADSVVREISQVFNESTEEKTTMISLFTVTESLYLARSLTVSIDLNGVTQLLSA